MTFLRRQPAGSRTARQRAGDAAENAAAEHLVSQGCVILARNQRFREGELDIVAQEGDTMVFVEVRLRSSDRFGGPALSVDLYKRRRLVRAAQHFMQRRFGGSSDGSTWPACRFDVIAADADGVKEWIKGAFSADE
jgi:putative endonuclease